MRRHLFLLITILVAVPIAAHAAAAWRDFAVIDGSRTASTICSLDTTSEFLKCSASNPSIDASGNVTLLGQIVLPSFTGGTGVGGASSTESDPQVGTLTSNLFCQVNAGGTAIDCTSSAGTQRTALGLGSIATQAAGAVAVTGGAIDGTTVGATTQAAGGFTTLAATSATTLSSTLSVTGQSNLGVVQLTTDNAAACSVAGDVGKFRYNSATGKFQVCK